MKLRIIKEKSVYRIKELCHHFFGKPKWEYASKSIVCRTQNGYYGTGPKDFKTEKEAEDFIEHNYVVKVVKEYEVE